MTQQYLLRLSWPARPLWQNWRGHWKPVRTSTAAQLQEAWALAKHHSVRCDPNATLTFEFHPPNRIKRDCQNLPATVKAAIDGIAKAMGCDDAGFRCRWPETLAEPVKGGAVLITIEVGQ